ncbi:MAG: SLBB domain-containing protein [Candidatus Latescibacteria bacterium]|nr:SLBB domain-containing protein [Candidatus Latescibacterota bacterium]
MRKPVSFILCGLLVAMSAQIVTPSVGVGQEAKVERPGASKYYISLGPEDELMMKINVWGSIAKPGQYLVPTGTDLIALLSYAGGPTESARISDVRIVRIGSKEKAIFSVDIKKYLETGDAFLVPTLIPGDTIIVPATMFHMFSRFVSFVSQMAIVANVYYLLFVRGG